MMMNNRARMERPVYRSPAAGTRIFALFAAMSIILVSSCSNPLRERIEDLVEAHRQVTQDGIIYVCRASGDDANPGLPDKPKRTIQAAIDFMDENGITGAVRVAEGTYVLGEEESIVIPQGVSLYGGYARATWARDYDRYETIVEKDPQNSIITVQFEAGVTRDTVLDGFVIRAGVGVDTIAVAILEASPTVRNNYIDAYGALEESVGVWINRGGPLLEWNTIAGGAGPNKSTGIILHEDTGAAIRYNAIVPGVRSNTVAFGIRATHSKALIEHNWIAGADEGGSQTGGIRLQGGTTEINGNIVDGGGGSSWSAGIIASDSAHTRIVSNVLHGGWSSGSFSRGIEIGEGGAATVRNNTIGAGTNSNSIGIAAFSGGSMIENNLLFSQAASGNRYGVYEHDSGCTPASVWNNAFFDLDFLYVYPDDGEHLGVQRVSDMESYLTDAGASAGDNALPDDSLSTVLVDISDHINDGWDLSASAPTAVTQGGLYRSDEPFPRDRLGYPRTIPWSIGAYERD